MFPLSWHQEFRCTMAENEKLSEIMEMFRGLSEEEKGDFMSKLAEDEELMTRLLNILIGQTENQTQGEVTETGTFIDFLRKVKQ